MRSLCSSKSKLYKMVLQVPLNVDSKDLNKILWIIREKIWGRFKISYIVTVQPLRHKEGVWVIKLNDSVLLVKFVPLVWLVNK